MHDGSGHERVTKTFPVFDCDAHINDPDDDLDGVRRARVPRAGPAGVLEGRRQAVLNGRTVVIGGGSVRLPRLQPDLHRRAADEQEDHAPAPADRRSRGEQQRYVEHRGAYDPHGAAARHGPHGHRSGDDHPHDDGRQLPVRRERRRRRCLLRARTTTGCATTAPRRPSDCSRRGWLPLQSPEYTCRELERIAELGLPRRAHPPDRRARQVSQLHLPGHDRRLADRDHGPASSAPSRRPGMVLGMHTFPAMIRGGRAARAIRRSHGVTRRPGRPRRRDARRRPHGRRPDLSFIFEAVAWLAQVLLSGMLDLYPKLRMAIFESNSQLAAAAARALGPAVRAATPTSAR